MARRPLTYLLALLLLCLVVLVLLLAGGRLQLQLGSELGQLSVEITNRLK